MTLLPSWVTGMSRSAPPKLPMAVLTPSTMTTSFIFNAFALVTRAINNGLCYAVLKTFRNVTNLIGVADAGGCMRGHCCLLGLRGIFLFSASSEICRSSKFHT